MRDQLQNTPLDLIDDPHEPMRSEMDDEKLDELARSIREHGLIQPITLRKTGERFEVVAGHRRFKACKRAGLAVVAAIVRELEDAQADTMRMHENLYREDVNPVDEAHYIRLMIDKHKVEPAELCKMTGKSESYLRARYDLLDYPEYLLLSVKEERISLTAAHWLNKITDENIRKEYTRFAVNGGITAKRAEAWYQSWLAGQLPREAHTYQAPQSDPSAPPPKLQMPCILCRAKDDIDNMGMDYAHYECIKAVEEMQNRDAPRAESVRLVAPGN